MGFLPVYVCSLRLIYLYFQKKKWKKKQPYDIILMLERLWHVVYYSDLYFIFVVVVGRIGSSELMNLLFCLDFLHFVCGFCFVLFFFIIIITLDIAQPTLHAPRTTPSSF